MQSTFPSVLKRARGACLLALASLALGCASPGGAVAANANSTASARLGSEWVGAWGTAPAGPPLPAAIQTFSNQTLRLIVHTSIGGTQVRVRVSNELSKTPLRIGEARVALRASGAEIVSDSNRQLTFSGMTSITVPAGAPVLSDPVDLDVPALSDLAISLHLPGEV